MNCFESCSLGYSVGHEDILKDINFSVEQGEFFVLIGPTGSGKTTLLKLLDLLQLPTAGEITICGERVGSSFASRLALRRRMAFVQQKPVPFNMDLFSNVALGMRWRKFPASQIGKRVEEALRLVGLNGKERQNARTLSGGEMQRAAIARAMVLDPEILFLDEPTANLDPGSSARIEEVLARIIREGRMTVVMATHDMTMGQRMGQRVGVMMGGRLLQIGKPSEVFSSPKDRVVAGFVGVDNIWPGVVEGIVDGMLAIRVGGHLVTAAGHFARGEAVDALIRPEDITLYAAETITSARNIFKCSVTALSSEAPLVRVRLDCGFEMTALVTRRSADELGLAPGTTLYAAFKASSVRVIRRIVS